MTEDILLSLFGAFALCIVFSSRIRKSVLSVLQAHDQAAIRARAAYRAGWRTVRPKSERANSNSERAQAKAQTA